MIFLIIGAISMAILAIVLIWIHSARKLKHAQSELIQQRAALDEMCGGVAIVNTKGEVTYANPDLYKILSITNDQQEERDGQKWEQLFSTFLPEHEQLPFFQALHSGSSLPVTTETINLDSQSQSLSMAVKALPDGSLICTLCDMTDETQSEQEKKDLQEQFYQSQKMEAIGRLAGGIAHDFNNILAAINGYAEFLIDDLEAGSQTQGFAKNILQAGSKARGLVDQMLSFSRRKENSRVPMDLHLSVKDTIAMLNASLPKTIDVEENIEIEDAYIHGNISQITQVLMNLCVNASDAMEDTHGTLQIDLKPFDISEFEQVDLIRPELANSQDAAPISIQEYDAMRTILTLGTIAKNQPYYRLSITDSGAGMSRVIMEHIFEPFFTTKPVDKGTGLGLAMVHGAVTAHQGCMIIDSTLGTGTRFDIYLPADITLARQDAGDETSELHSFEDVVILLVEDQSEVRDMTIRMLERAGVEAVEASGGVEALTILRENPGMIDIVITDYNMPQMTGLELIQHAGVECPNVPFILLSGYSQEKMGEMIDEQKNVFAVLRKPVGKDKLMRKISSVIAKMRTQIAA